MDDEVELAPGSFDLVEHGVDRGGVGHVAMADDEGVELLGERTDALLQRVALIGEGEVGARRAGRLGDAPGDGTVVGEAHDESAPAGKDGARGGGVAGRL